MSKVTIDRELLEQVAAELEDDNDRYMLGREIRTILAQPAQQGEAVEVVGWRRLDRPYELTAYPSVCAMWHGNGWPVQELYTHPAASVPAGCKVVPDGWSVFSMILNALDRDAAEGKAARGEMAAELRALLASAEGVRP